MPVDIDPSQGGVAVPSTLNPGTTAYLRYYVIENPQNELDEKFIESLYSLESIGTLSETDYDLEKYLDIKLAGFCKIWNYLSGSSQKRSSLFILSGTTSDDVQLHSMITFFCEQVGRKPTLVIDAFCSNQLLKNKIDNHGGRILFEAVNQACKKMKIKQIDLESVDEAVPWYLSKGFAPNFKKKDEGLTQLKKRISWSSRSPWTMSSSHSPAKPLKKTSKEVVTRVSKVIRKEPRKTVRKAHMTTVRKAPMTTVRKAPMTTVRKEPRTKKK